MTVSQTAREAAERIARLANDPRLATLTAEIIQSAMDAEATAQREANYALCYTNQKLALALVRMEEQRDAARAELADLHAKDSVRTKEHNILTQENRRLRAAIDAARKP